MYNIISFQKNKVNYRNGNIGSFLISCDHKLRRDRLRLTVRSITEFTFDGIHHKSAPENIMFFYNGVYGFCRNLYINGRVKPQKVHVSQITLIYELVVFDTEYTRKLHNSHHVGYPYPGLPAIDRRHSNTHKFRELSP